MEERHILLKLRTATADDFKTISGQTKVGAVFFRQSATGMIERKICYLNDDCNKQEFKELFNAGQIFVFDNPDEINYPMSKAIGL
jgi:hypothetical protein